MAAPQFSKIAPQAEGPEYPPQAACNDQPAGSVAKTCTKCGEEKPLAEFFFIRTESRHESGCKACKRLSRKRQKNHMPQVVHSRNATHPIKAHTAKRTIEPRNHETARLANDIDSIGSDEKNKDMSPLEKCDAIQRFNEFVTILREGYGEIVGSDVYIRKD